MTRILRRALVVGMVALGITGLHPLPTLAATTVQDCPTTEAALQSDITAAGAGGTVAFTCTSSTTISFSSPITISQSVTLDGSSSQPVILDGGESTRLFIVNLGNSFTVSHLTVQHGSAQQGGAIFNRGTLSITNSTLSGNSVYLNASAVGGAIFNDGGTVSVSNSTFSGNSSIGGGAIFTARDGTVSISNGTLSGNSSSGSGGAIYNEGSTLGISNSTLSGNSSSQSGGAIDSEVNATVTITGSTLSDNSSAAGGAIANNHSTLGISNSTLSGNSSTHSGGAIDNYGGPLTINDSTLSSNTVTFGNGGGIDNSQGTASISNSTLSGNTVNFGSGGGIDNSQGTLTISNSTLSSNIGNSSHGGGVFNLRGTASISNSTVAGNTVTFGSGGGISNVDGVLNIGGSIVAANSAQYGQQGKGNCGLSGIGTDAGYNLSDSNGGCGLTGPTDLINTDPQLDPTGLQNNGGPTPIIALLSTSPAIDRIPLSSGLCPSTDQRGAARPDVSGETSCDIGAYEFADTAPVITSSSSTSFQVDLPGSFTITATGLPTPSLSESGTLPSGVSFSDQHNGTATLSGIPAPGTGGIYHLTITAQNGVGAPAAQAFTLTVLGKSATTTSLSSSATSSLLHQPVTLTATVTADGGVPSGTVSFMEESTVLATVALDGSGKASFSSSSLGVGTHTITAVYGGSSLFLGSSASLTQQVTYKICPITLPFERVTKGHIKIKLQLCDASGADLSSPTITLTVVGLSPNPGVPAPTGAFAFIPLLGGTNGGYQYSVDATQYRPGIYILMFTVPGDPVVHQVQFTVT